MSGNFICRRHVEPRVKLCSPREESFPIPLKNIDVSRTTHTNLDVKQEKRIDDYRNIDGSRDLSDPGQVSLKLLYWKKTSKWIYVVQGETDKDASDNQTRSCMARTLGENVKEYQAEGDAKVVQ